MLVVGIAKYMLAVSNQNNSLMSNKSKKDIIKEKVLELRKQFNEWREEINNLIKNRAPAHEINNKVVEMRNISSKYIENTVSEIAIQKKYGEIINVPVRKSYQKVEKSYGKPCQICDEKRVYNVCHIIPRSEGGPNGKGNYVILCPTHHFLLDHARLSKEEFESIERSHLLPEARNYLENVHRKRHQMRWKYQTNRFSGCDCGSTDFKFDVFRDKSSVSIVLLCQECNEIWHNLWEEKHPITLISAYTYEINDGQNVDKFLDKAEKRAYNFISSDLEDLLKVDEW